MNSLNSSLERKYIIKTKKLTKKFGDEVAVNSVDMNIPDGAIFGLVGPSGCGKTTMIRLLTGIYHQTDGEISVLNKNPADFSNLDREKIGYLIQQDVLYPDLTVWENLNFAASFYGVTVFRKKRLNHLFDFVELSEHRDKITKLLSGGMKKRLGLATALVHDPQLLFLDEPTAGIDPILRQKFWDYFKELQSEGRTLIITTQYVGEAAYCDLVGVMFKGRLLLVDSPEGLRRKAYGGEIIGLTTNERIEYEQRVHIENLPFTKGKVTTIDDNEVEIIVDDAKSALPELMEICKRENLTVKSIDRIAPPFDDVFVRLIEDEIEVEGDVLNG